MTEQVSRRVVTNPNQGVGQVHKEIADDRYRDLRRPRKLRFYVNGDRYFRGKKLYVTPNRYYNFNDLLNDLTGKLPSNLNLPYGVRQIFTPVGGRRIFDIEDLADGETYVCAGFEGFKTIKYGRAELEPWSMARPQQNPSSEAEAEYYGSYRYRGYANNAFHPGRYFRTNHSYQQRRWPGTFGANRSGAYPINQSENLPHKPKVVTIVRNGAKPRHNVKILLNRRSVQSYEQLLSDISEAFGPKFRQNKVRKLYSVRGKEVLGISDFFRDDECFIALGVGESNLTDTDVADILEELFPEGQVSKSLLKEWDKQNQRRRRRVSPTGASVKSTKDSVGQGNANNVNHLNAVNVADKRDSGFDSSDASTNRSEPDQNGPPGYRKAMQQRRKAQQRDRESDRERDKDNQSETNSMSHQHGYYLMKKLEKERMKVAAEEKERAKRRQLKMAEAEKRAAEEEKRKRGLVPLKNINDPFKKNDDAKDKEREDARRRKEEERRKKEEERREVEKRQREKEERDAAEKAARERMAQAEREEKEKLEKERHEREKRDKEKQERDKRRTEKEESKNQGKSEKGAPSNTAAGGKSKEKPSSEVDAGNNDSGVGSGENGADTARAKNRPDNAKDVLKAKVKQPESVSSDPNNADESSAAKAEQSQQPEKQQQQSSPPQNQEPPPPQQQQESQAPPSENKDPAVAKPKEKRKHEKDDKQQQQQQQQQRKRAKTKIVRRTKAERQVSSDEYITSRYDLGRKLGDGNFAIVRQSRKKETGQEYAIKVIDKSKLKGKEHMVEHEIDIMKDCSHNNIVRLYEEYETIERIYLVMELVKGGDLFDAITQSVKFGEVDSSLMVRDLCNALFYLHSRSIVHRDLKPENLLVHRNKDGSITLKLADFGLAMEVKELIYTVCGTPTYVAPEILTEIGYGLEVDMWAVGVITYILLCGFPPFRSPDRNQTELFEFIKAGEYEFLSPYWDNTSRSAKDLIQRLLVVDRRKRYTSVDVLSHKWVVCCGDTDTLPEGALTIDSACKDTRKELDAQARVNYESYQRLKEKKRKERLAVEE